MGHYLKGVSTVVHHDRERQDVIPWVAQIGRGQFRGGLALCVGFGDDPWFPMYGIRSDQFEEPLMGIVWAAAWLVHAGRRTTVPACIEEATGMAAMHGYLLPGPEAKGWWVKVTESPFPYGDDDDIDVRLSVDPPSHYSAPGLKFVHAFDVTEPLVRLIGATVTPDTTYQHLVFYKNGDKPIYWAQMRYQP